MPTPRPIIAAMVVPEDGMSMRCPARPTAASDATSPVTPMTRGSPAAAALRKPTKRITAAAARPMSSLCPVSGRSTAAARSPPGVTSIPAASAGPAASVIRCDSSGVMSRPVTSRPTVR